MLGQATKLARDMVTRYGMSEKLGPTAIHYDDNGLSGTTRSLVEQEARPWCWSPEACFCCARFFWQSLWFSNVA